MTAQTSKVGIRSSRSAVNISHPLLDRAGGRCFTPVAPCRLQWAEVWALRDGEMHSVLGNVQRQLLDLYQQDRADASLMLSQGSAAAKAHYSHLAQQAQLTSRLVHSKSKVCPLARDI
jgi:hypothetical protein